MTPEHASELAAKVCALAPVIPVLVVDDASVAGALAQALVDGGLPALEVTLRTPAALDVIREMAKIDGGVVGAGTLLTSTDRLLDACEANDLPLLPGAATATESMALLERGYTVQKFFPAEANGGAPALKGIGGPLLGVKWCPTGGVSLANALTYLSLSNTLCVGGSWVAPKNLVDAQDWAGITALAAEAAALPR